MFMIWSYLEWYMYLLSLRCTVLVPLALTMFMISRFHVSLTICFFDVLSRDLLHLRFFPNVCSRRLLIVILPGSLCLGHWMRRRKWFEILLFFEWFALVLCDTGEKNCYNSYSEKEELYHFVRFISCVIWYLLPGT